MNDRIEKLTSEGKKSTEEIHKKIDDTKNEMKQNKMTWTIFLTKDETQNLQTHCQPLILIIFS